MMENLERRAIVSPGGELGQRWTMTGVPILTAS